MTTRFLVCTKTLNDELKLKLCDTRILGHTSILVDHMLFEHLLQIVLEQDVSRFRYGIEVDMYDTIFDYLPQLNPNLIDHQGFGLEFAMIKQIVEDLLFDTIGGEVDIVNYDIICTNLLMVTCNV